MTLIKNVVEQWNFVLFILPNRHIINIGDATNAPILTDFIYAYTTEL